MDKRDKAIILYTSVSLFFSALLLRSSGFSASSVVNFYNHIIKSIIFSANTDTFAALRLFLGPFVFVLLSLAFFTLSVALLAFHGSRSDSSAGKISGTFGAIISIVLFPSITGIFLAAAIFICFFYAPRFSGMYAKEAKKWARFRIGSNTAGKIFMIFNVIMAVGVFSSVLVNQSNYEASFRQEIKESVRAIALSLPGAANMPADVLEQRIDSTAASLTGSKFFSAYIVWLPISAAFTAWIILEFLRNLIFSNLCGLFTYLMLKKSGTEK